MALSLGVARFLQSLVAVVGGNAVYFLLIDPRLPQNMRHKLYKLDFAVAIDFWVCVVIWGALETLRRAFRRRP